MRNETEQGRQMNGTMMILRDPSMTMDEIMGNRHWNIGDETPAHLIDATTRKNRRVARQSELMEASVTFTFPNDLPIAFIDTHGRTHGRDDETDDDMWKTLLIASALSMTDPDDEVLFVTVSDPIKDYGENVMTRIHT